MGKFELDGFNYVRVRIIRYLRIHTGCDTARRAKYRGRSSFNPRTHTGCDLFANFAKEEVWGFNPRTHTGCDVARLKEALDDKVSIHAPTRGATPWANRPLVSRKVSIHAPTRGATLPGATAEEGAKVSIHAPTRGATERRH